MQRKSFKYRLSPNKEQKQKLQWTLDRCRELYNAALQERKDAYEMHVRRSPNYYDEEWRKQAAKECSINYYDQSGQVSEMKELRPEYKDIPVVVIRDPLDRVDKAFKAFYRRVKAGQTPGYPRFQGKHRYDSFTYIQTRGFSLTHDNRLYLYNIGSIKVKLHREIEGKVKTCTIKREDDLWYVVFVCEVEQVQHLPYTDEAIGIDLGLSHFATLSTGDTIENPRYYRAGEAKLRKAQEHLSRCKKGSHRREKARKQVAKAHRKVRNQRNDFLHKQSRQLVNTYETIVFEDLAPVNMSKRPKSRQDENGKYLPNGASAKAGLNKSIHDAGWATFVSMCQYKAANAGTSVLQVNPKYTSQVCSGCGVIRKKELSERWHSCECGCELDRDHNAAINILRLGSSQQSAMVVEVS